jgi:hypothetical protein
MLRRFPLKSNGLSKSCKQSTLFFAEEHGAPCQLKFVPLVFLGRGNGFLLVLPVIPGKPMQDTCPHMGSMIPNYYISSLPSKTTRSSPVLKRNKRMLRHD